MSRILFMLVAIAGMVHIVFFAGPQMTGASPLFMLLLGAAGCALTFAVEHRASKRRQRKAALERARR